MSEPLAVLQLALHCQCIECNAAECCNRGCLQVSSNKYAATNWQAARTRAHMHAHMHPPRLLYCNAVLLAGSPCSLTQKLLPPSKPKPQVQLQPNPAATVFVAYGKPAAFYLGACSSGLDNSSCGAVAWDVQPGQGREDLTPYMTVTQSADGCDPADGQVGGWEGRQKGVVSVPATEANVPLVQTCTGSADAECQLRKATNIM